MKELKRNKEGFVLNAQGMPMRIAVCFPTGDVVQTEFMLHFNQMVSYCLMNGIHTYIINQRSSLVEVARNNLVKAALQSGADKVFFLDSDMTFPETIIETLLKADKDVICCDAMRRRPPFDTVVRGLDKKLIDHVNCEEDYVELTGGSVACALIDTKVFGDIKGVPFKTTWNEDGNYLGEDYYFTNRVIEAGYKYWCDIKASRSIGHISDIELSIGKWLNKEKKK